MKRKVWIMDTAAELLFYILAVIGSFYAMISPFVIEHSRMQVIGGGVVFCILFYWICHRRTWMRYLLGAAVLLLASMILLRDSIAEGILSTAESLLPYINSYFGGRLEISGETAAAGPELLFLVILYLWSALCGSSYFLIRRKGFASILIMLVSLLPAVMGQFPETLPVAAVLLGWIGLQVMGTVQSRIIKGRLAVIAAGFFVAILAVAWFVLQPHFEKVRQDSIEYKVIIKDADYEAAWDRIPFLNRYEFLFGIGDFGAAGITDGDLTGSSGFFKSKKPALEITLDYRPRQTIYLRGYCGTNYTGTRWEEAPTFNGSDIANLKAGMEEWYQEICGDIQSLQFLDIEMKNEFLEMTDPEQTRNSDIMKVEILGANDSYVYLPYFADVRGETGLVGDLYQVNENKETVYEISFYSQEAAGDINENIQELHGVMRFGNEMLSEYAFMYMPDFDETYFQLPQSGLERLIAQCEEQNLTSIEYITEYIKETLREIPYNLNVDRAPAEEDFAEYFLYESREGYCMHFATTAALMYRAFGVPSRYVTGYVIPPSLFSKNEDGTYSARVPADKAHAWAEIYGGEEGWTYVETTPGYGGNTMNVSAQGGASDPYRTEERQTAAQQEMRGNNNRNRKDEQDSLVKMPIIWYCAAGLGAVLLFAAGIEIQRKVRARKRRKGNVKELFHSIHELMVFGGYGDDIDYLEGRTQENICTRFHIDKDGLEKAICLAYEANFSAGHGKLEDRAFMKEFYSNLAGNVYGQLRPGKKLIFRYIKCFK